MLCKIIPPPQALENQEFYDKWAWIKTCGCKKWCQKRSRMTTPKAKMPKLGWKRSAMPCTRPLLPEANHCKIIPNISHCRTAWQGIPANLAKHKTCVSKKLNYLDTRKPVQSAESGTWDLVTVTSGCSPSKDVTWMRCYLEIKKGVFNIYVYEWTGLKMFERAISRRINGGATVTSCIFRQAHRSVPSQ